MAATAAAAAPGGGPVGDALYGTKLVGSDRGWAVGAFGTILRTDDAGRTWAASPAHTTQHLYDVDFVDRSHGWIVGRSGIILHTADGGQTWRRQDGGAGKHLFGVDFADDNCGVAVGDWGVIVVTRDGGRTWEDRSLGSDIILNDVSMLDCVRGWTVGERGTVLATSDGGRSWAALPTGVDKTLFGVHLADDRGWVVGIDGLILHSADGGTTWQVQNGSTDVRAPEQVGFAAAHDTPSLYAIDIADQFGIAVGEAGAVFLSTDAGRSWTRQVASDAGRVRWYRAVSLASGGGGVIVGADGQRSRIAGGRIHGAEGGGRAAQTVR
ncbi:MAG: WD40/YVTN/BNR-like repeat-containing protein [Candidatus Binatia bacterium]